MIKVLIVDDEIFTREGIIAEIPWAKLGPIEIEQAYDGINALEVAEKFEPDILLTDVKMPRMNGVELSFELRKTYPTCEIIFLSGYSDKQYLKSAIELKAVSYVEKPIDIEELQSAIKNAITLKIKETENTLNIKNDIALKLIQKNADFYNLGKYIDVIPESKLTGTSFITILINILNKDKIIEEAVLLELKKIVVKSNFNCILCYKEDDLILMHLYFPADINYLSVNSILEHIYNLISEYLKSFTTFFICQGKKVIGITNIPVSYSFAVDALSKVFFYDYNSVIYYDKISLLVYNLDENLIENFTKNLLNEDKQNSILLINRLTSEIKGSASTPINYTKDVYYRLLHQLLKFSYDRNLIINQNDLDNKSPFEYLANSYTLMDIKSYMIEKIHTIFDAVEEKNSNINPVSSILKYIHDNYSDVDLSLQNISNKTYLSTAYMCSIFKEETGTTINSYITKYRINKAKDLLKDPHMKIIDITTKVGYGDGNYFSKIFKKETGLTPSEYKKKFL
ncbi:response regulator transcription factor [Clostridium estertheticum]|uniref:response regulator transcription factor n=1 Tax=Clostridium estertheticum TaxID=238834 RepID=UPI001C0BA597|nr:response regulator [Clostridium estertheticum]MBU3072014.1 response regulator [Clostridium estertheticum]MBU3162106.1 response regulator [Clostridium estertheticum]